MSGSEKHQSISAGENNGYTEILNDAKLRSEYRNRLADALRLVSSYAGKEKEYKDIMKVLIDLEAWLKDVFGISSNLRLPIENEEKALESWHPAEVRRKIADLMDIAERNYEKTISRSLNHSSRPESEKEIFTIQLDGIILPPAFTPNPIKNGSGAPPEDPHFKERLKKLLLLLAQNGIYSDDVILISGNVHETMMRKESYTIIEIPKLNREILVCDQVGEATFVIYGILGRRTLMLNSKEDLQNTYGATVIRIVHRDDIQWQSDILKNLFKNVNIESLKKIDIKTQEGLRSEILKLKPTPQSWADMNKEDKKQFKIFRMGLNAIARKIGVEGNPANNHSVHLEIGRKIYGEEHKCLQYEEKPDLTPEKLKQEILKLKPTPKSWVAMEVKERKRFKISGIGLFAIARKFDVEGNPVSNLLPFLELGRKIYGKEHKCLKEITPDKLIKEILKLKPTPQSWVDMVHKEKKQFKIFSIGLVAIARKLGVQGSPVEKQSVFLELGRKIYGEEHKCLKCEEKPDLTVEQLTQEILKLKSTPESWANMSQKEKYQFKTSGMGLYAIATKFGVKENPTINKSNHLALGRKIYGEGHECLKEITLDKIKQEILKLKPTSESWGGMKQKERGQLKIFGIGLVAIATKFGVIGNTVNNSSINLELGRKIYGEEHECLKPKS
jgi:hypothetical protein